MGAKESERKGTGKMKKIMLTGGKGFFCSRLADYYLQFTVLFIPMIFYSSDRSVQINKNAAPPILSFNQRSMQLLVLVLVVALIWWYYTTCIGVTIEYSVDDYTNFRFMWDVIE